MWFSKHSFEPRIIRPRSCLLGVYYRRERGGTLLLTTLIHVNVNKSARFFFFFGARIFVLFDQALLTLMVQSDRGEPSYTSLIGLPGTIKT